MDYFKHYNLLIERAKSRNLDGYKERHHIVPRCMNGTDDKSNIVELTPEEHYVAHQLLVKMYPDVDGLVYAVNKMAVSSKYVKRNNKRYGWLRRRYQHICKKRVGKKNPSYGRRWYYNPNTMENGKFLEKDIPTGWIKGRASKTKKRYCKTCSVYIDTVDVRNRKEIYCINHRYDYVKKNKTKNWHTPAGIFDNPIDAANANNCSRKTVYNRVKSSKHKEYFITAR
jgi:hypothetical protein